MIFVPYFVGERSRESARLRDGEVVAPPLPEGPAQQRLAVLYEALAALVQGAARPRVQVGDCTAALGVMAGLQRRGLDPWLIWLDAHGDFNTWGTTPSGFLGGMPLAMLAGLGEQTVMEALGLRPLRAERILLAGTRDLDPGERDNLARARVPLVTVDQLASRPPPAGPVYVHLDVDVVNLSEMPAVDYPAAGGPAAAEVRAALDHVFAEAEVAAFSVTGWNPEKPGSGRSRATTEVLVSGLVD